MSTSQEAPALIQYACERCKTRFVLPPSSRQLKLGGKLRAVTLGLGRTFRLHEGLGAAHDTARRELLAKMDDEAYQSFVKSFRFCHECRQFVCNECWSTSRRSCLTCVAKSMTGTVRPRAPFAPTGPEIPRPVVAAAVPRKGRMRRDMALVALALAIVLVSLEAGYLLVGATSGTASASPTPIFVMDSASPGDTSTASTSENLTGNATASPTEIPTEIPTPTLPPSLPPGVTPSPRPLPLISCNGSSTSLNIHNNVAVSCSWINPWYGSTTRIWYLDSAQNGSSSYWSSLSVGTHTIHLHAGQATFLDSNYVTIYVTAAPPGSTPTPVITPSPTPTPTPTPIVTAPPKPAISCSPLSATTSDPVSCSWNNIWSGSPALTWYLDGSPSASSWSSLPAGDHPVYLHAVLDGVGQDSNTVTIHVAPPAPTSPPPPAISCSPLSATTSDPVSCSWDNPWSGSPTETWYLDGSPDASSWSSLPAGVHQVYLHAVLDGVGQDSNTVTITVT